MGLMYLVPTLMLSQYIYITNISLIIVNVIDIKKNVIITKVSLNFQVVSEYNYQLLISDDVLDHFNTSHVDALCMESLQGSARRTRRTRSAPTEQIAIFLLSNKRKGKYIIIIIFITSYRLFSLYMYLFNI